MEGTAEEGGGGGDDGGGLELRQLCWETKVLWSSAIFFTIHYSHINIGKFD